MKSFEFDLMKSLLQVELTFRKHLVILTVLRNGFRTGAGSGRSVGERAEVDQKSFGADGKQKGLGFNSCVAPSYTQCPTFSAFS